MASAGALVGYAGTSSSSSAEDDEKEQEKSSDSDSSQPSEDEVSQRQALARRKRQRSQDTRSDAPTLAPPDFEGALGAGDGALGVAVFSRHAAEAPRMEVAPLNAASEASERQAEEAIAAAEQARPPCSLSIGHTHCMQAVAMEG